MASRILVVCTIFRISLLIILPVFISIIKPSVSSICSTKTFLLSPLHNDTEPVEPPTKQLNDSSITACSIYCYNDANCSGFVYLYDGKCSLFSTRFYDLSFVNKTGTQVYELNPSDCYDVKMSGANTSGVYTIDPGGNGRLINVSCEITSEESWLIIQRRTDGSEDFYRTWNEYRDGFGDLSNEFWLGNSNIHHITSQGHYELKIDLEDFDGNTSYALYKNFFLSSEEDYFRLSIGEYSGEAGDSLRIHNGLRFSTMDKDVDMSTGRCAKSFKGAWWYGACHNSNLNGQYLGGPNVSRGHGVQWSDWKGYLYSLKETQMKIRPMTY